MRLCKYSKIVRVFNLVMICRQFDENLLRRISELHYEDEVVNLPSPPDVSDYLMLEVIDHILLVIQREQIMCCIF